MQNYDVIKLIGKGGFSKVILGINLKYHIFSETKVNWETIRNENNR